MVEMPPLGPADVILHVAPLSHLSGYFEPTCSARGVAHLVHDAFDPAAVLDAIERRRVSVIPLVPTMLNMMLPEPGEDAGRDFSSLRAVMYGGRGSLPTGSPARWRRSATSSSSSSASRRRRCR